MLLLITYSTHAHATLSAYSSNGADLVYSSASNVTWTKDANLLGTMMQTQGFDTVINAIIAVTPGFVTAPDYYDYGNDQVPAPGFYSLSSKDFNLKNPGQTSWYGAMAFANYLNSIEYGGSNQWVIPGTSGGDCNFYATGSICGYNVNTNGTQSGDELAELYYGETGSKGAYDSNANFQPDYGFNDANDVFTNETASYGVSNKGYWTSAEQQIGQNIRSGYFAENAGFFNMQYGYQDTNSKTPLGAYYDLDENNNIKRDENNKIIYIQASVGFYAWAISPGQISAVPETSTTSMLLAGLGMLGWYARRRVPMP